MKNIFFAFLTLIVLTGYAQVPVPSDADATPETIHLYRHMMKLQHQGLMFGHQDDLAYGKGWYDEAGRSDVKDVCGDYPAVYGWELGHLEQGSPYSLDSVYFDKIRGWIKTVYKRGGINTVSWHLNNPLTGGTAWDVSSREVVASILPGGEKHELFVLYLDRLADFLLSLKTGDGTYIPIIFRPFHEHTGSWFWWGRDLCSVDQYKALWRFTVTYLRDTKHIHHLLYTYSTGGFKTKDEYLERYPGDDLIDVLAFDLYDRGPDYPDILRNCASIVSGLARVKNKIGTVSEAGGPISKNTAWWTDVLLKTLRPFDLSYVLVWRNPWNKPEEAFAPYKGHPGSADFMKFYHDPKTLFQKDISSKKLYR
jgi:mannan endo-1,4-beta-mannosidase